MEFSGKKDNYYNMYYMAKDAIRSRCPKASLSTCVVEISSLIFFIVSTPTMDMQLLFSFMCSVSMFNTWQLLPLPLLFYAVILFLG